MATIFSSSLRYGALLALAIITGVALISWARVHTVPAYEASVHQNWGYDTYGDVVLLPAGSKESWNCEECRY